MLASFPLSYRVISFIFKKISAKFLSLDSWPVAQSIIARKTKQLFGRHFPSSKSPTAQVLFLQTTTIHWDAVGLSLTYFQFHHQNIKRLVKGQGHIKSVIFIASSRAINKGTLDETGNSFCAANALCWWTWWLLEFCPTTWISSKGPAVYPPFMQVSTLWNGK